MAAPVGEAEAPGVRAATPLPRSWCTYLAVRPEAAPLCCLMGAVLVLGLLARNRYSV